MAGAKACGAVRVMLRAMLLSCAVTALVDATVPWAVTDWNDAHATFYGGMDAAGTMGGACGYTNMYAMGYGTKTAALSNALFNKGLTCGACFELVCKTDATNWCYSGKSILITATNNCPQGSYGGWCDYPKLHFDLSYPMFQTLAQPVGGVIPIQYRRVQCTRTGGVQFLFNGNPYYNNVLVYNVAGPGDIAQLYIKGAKTDWILLQQAWGQYWSGGPYLCGQSLSFKGTLGSGETMEFWNVAPETWQNGQTYQAQNNFS